LINQFNHSLIVTAERSDNQSCLKNGYNKTMTTDLQTTLPCRLRQAIASDTPAILSLVRSVIEEYKLPFEPDGIDEDLQNVLAHYPAPHSAFFVAETVEAEGHSGLIGTIGLHQYQASIGELCRFYLAPAYRGHGLGKAILKAYLQSAYQRGYQTIILETHSCMQEALGLYQRFGFQPRERFSNQPDSFCNQALELNLNHYMQSQAESLASSMVEP
jgi:putative acetyltransferase